MHRLENPVTELSQAALVGLSEWIDAGNAHRDPEALTLHRLIKLTEESGEVVTATIGALGANPRKGVTNTFEKVLEELLDVAITALGAYEHIGGHQGRALSELDGKIVRVAERAGVLPPDSTSAAEPQEHEYRVVAHVDGDVYEHGPIRATVEDAWAAEETYDLLGEDGLPDGTVLGIQGRPKARGWAFMTTFEPRGKPQKGCDPEPWRYFDGTRRSAPLNQAPGNPFGVLWEYDPRPEYAPCPKPTVPDAEVT
jgi:hypothetical protein